MGDISGRGIAKTSANRSSKRRRLNEKNLNLQVYPRFAERTPVGQMGVGKSKPIWRAGRKDQATGIEVRLAADGLAQAERFGTTIWERKDTIRTFTDIVLMFVLLGRAALRMCVLMSTSTGHEMGVSVSASGNMFVLVGNAFVDVMSATTGHGVPKHRKHGQNGCGRGHVRNPSKSL
ncbi:hypothetical protein DTL42_01635 [Bremerella cremea]|uniref:Uncharacterized protein n=1 Tax=Bremerella cremea TaxID=1031537 RepID=A0A368KU95_9BACT|nr:hypothetical protein [Bremerella cremea]RCS53896.1 hypothetical protein DTL42_01635 [Bremerella cremea]